MGVSIHLYSYNVDDVVNQIIDFAGTRTEGKDIPDEFFAKVSGEFGLVDGDSFHLVYNEYYEEYNPSYEFNRAVTEYYGEDPEPARSWESDFSLKNGKYSGGGANADEVLSSVYGEDYE